jgi:hypothetical protein
MGLITPQSYIYIQFHNHIGVDHIFKKIISYFHKCKHKHSTFARITIKAGRGRGGLDYTYRFKANSW